MNNQDPYPPAGYLMRYVPRVVRGLPAYIDTALDDEHRDMIHFIISNTARYRRIHLCPGYLTSGHPYHRLTMDLMGYDVEFQCLYCTRPGHIREEEQRHLSRLSETYRARAEFRYDLTQDPPVLALPPSRSLTPSPPRSPGAHPPPSPPAQASGSGRQGDPIDLDAVDTALARPPTPLPSIFRPALVSLVLDVLKIPWTLTPYLVRFSQVNGFLFSNEYKRKTTLRLQELNRPESYIYGV
ncbi:hypothetical protein K435DRAFT_808513 [Dendrothele bispora CBS 962.96]|uniref:Uncharacterized protein n=1 Tax=Dendrothele bispora (strain CBS 962.96) TaxID=1314807 RepID=A0A4S8L1F0_DENBC|nr:hypothetical protein K435DRAFT_808513 [Dendrothele bispora CBS 962.96]